MGATACTLVVWNLLTSSVHWALPLSVASLTADPNHPVFAAALDAGVLSPISPEAPAAAGGSSEQGRGAEQAAREGGDTPGEKAAGEKGASKSRASQEAQDAAAAAGAAPGTPGQRTGSEGAQGEAAAGAGSTEAACRGKRAAAVVLVFDPMHPTPLLGTVVPRTLHACLSFVSPSMPQYAQLGGGSSSGSSAAVSPLLVLSETRAYAYLEPEGRAAARAAGDAEAGAAGAGVAKAGDQQGISAFEAAFGALTAAQPSTGEDTEMADAAGSGKPKWRALFDAPSHALPPPTALAQAFLSLLTTNTSS